MTRPCHRKASNRLCNMPDRLRQNRALELPEIITGILALCIVLWEICFEPRDGDELTRRIFTHGIHLGLFVVVGANTLIILARTATALYHKCLPNRMLCWQIIVGLSATFTFAAGVWEFLPTPTYWVSLALGLVLGAFSLISIGAIISEKRSASTRTTRHRWSPAASFFTMMATVVLVSTLIIMTPGASNVPISFVDALFTCSSATSITGLTCINISSALSPIGKTVVLFDFQVGAMGVMFFVYYVLLMMGKKINMRDNAALSTLLDQDGVSVVPSLLKSVFFVTIGVELIGATYLYFHWMGHPGIPQNHLWFYAIFHAVSAFCNAGITLFPNNMMQEAVVHDHGAQGVMMALITAGTLGFGVYLEIFRRLGLRFKRLRARVRTRLWALSNKLRVRMGKEKLPMKSPDNAERYHLSPRWSTHTWLVLRVTIIVLLLGYCISALLCLLEPSAHPAQQNAPSPYWEALWNTIGRSAGFNISDISLYGPVYQIFMCVLMFVGGNPSGTGGGVFAPVVALCVLEVIRVLRGQQDVQIHARRIARSTIERAMATVVLSIFWIIVTTMILLLLEPGIAASSKGLLDIFYLEVSAYTTTGFSIADPAALSDTSKCILAANMLFGRMGMFTFMLLFIKPSPPSPFRYPETRLPLN